MGTDLHWTTVREPAELVMWETAWNNVPEENKNTAALPPRIFPPSLLSEADIRFVAAYQGREIGAGAIANRTGDVVGVSNVFAPEVNAGLGWIRA